MNDLSDCISFAPICSSCAIWPGQKYILIMLLMISEIGMGANCGYSDVLGDRLILQDSTIRKLANVRPLYSKLSFYASNCLTYHISYCLLIVALEMEKLLNHV